MFVQIAHLRNPTFEVRTFIHNLPYSNASIEERNYSTKYQLDLFADTATIPLHYTIQQILQLFPLNEGWYVSPSCTKVISLGNNNPHVHFWELHSLGFLFSIY